MTLREFRRLTASMDDDTYLVVATAASMAALAGPVLLPPEEDRPVPYLVFRLLQEPPDEPES